MNYFKLLIKKFLNFYPGGSFLYDIPGILRSSQKVNSSRRKLRRSIAELKNLNITPIYLDVGSAGGLSRLWGYLQELQLIKIISIDLNNKWGKTHNLINTAIGHIDGKHDFYITRHPGCCSCLEPDRNVVKKYHIEKYFEVKNKTTIELKRFDTLVKERACDVPHFIKMDIQGFEYQSLEGFGEYLENVLALELETQFTKMYKGQKTFFELHDFLINNGFCLRGIEQVNWPSLAKDERVLEWWTNI